MLYINIIVALLATYVIWDDHDKDLSSITLRYICLSDSSRLAPYSKYM